MAEGPGGCGIAAGKSSGLGKVIKASATAEWRPKWSVLD
jgi:hypothetical protein